MVIVVLKNSPRSARHGVAGLLPPTRVSGSLLSVRELSLGQPGPVVVIGPEQLFVGLAREFPDGGEQIG